MTVLLDPQSRFMALLSSHQKIVFKVARMYCWTTEDRSDLEQEIVVNLWRAFPSYDESRAFSTWMYRIALNVAISFVRQTSARAKRFVSFEEHDLEPVDLRAERDVDDRERDARVEALYEFIAGLDGMNRALLLLYLEDRSYREMADVLGISETNVGTKINRLKERMRTTLRPQAGAHHGTR